MLNHSLTYLADMKQDVPSASNQVPVDILPGSVIPTWTKADQDKMHEHTCLVAAVWQKQLAEQEMLRRYNQYRDFNLS